MAHLPAGSTSNSLNKAFKAAGQTHVGISLSQLVQEWHPWAEPIPELFPLHPLRLCHRLSSLTEIPSSASSGTNLLPWSSDPTLCGHARWGFLNTHPGRQKYQQELTQRDVTLARLTYCVPSVLCQISAEAGWMVCWTKLGKGWFENKKMELKRSWGFHTQGSTMIIPYQKTNTWYSGSKIHKSIVNYKF